MGAVSFVRATGSDRDKAESVYGEYRVVRGNVTFSASYATGGDTVSMGSVGLQEVRRILVDPDLDTNTSGLSIALGGTPSAPKLLAYDATATEVVNATNLSARGSVPVWFLGKG